MFVTLLIATLNIVISEYIKRNRFPQRPQVRLLSEVGGFPLDLTYVHSYQALMRLSVLKPPTHIPVTDSFYTRMLTFRSSSRKAMILQKWV